MKIEYTLPFRRTPAGPASVHAAPLPGMPVRRSWARSRRNA